MKTITLPFEIGDKVKILELDRPGTVTAVHISLGGIRYEVRYFWEGEARDVYFFDWEIEAK